MSVEILQSLATVAKHYQTGTTKVVETNMFYYIARVFFLENVV